jgi:hypothetical protein
MENHNDKILKKLYSGGMQRHFPKNEAQIYMAKFTLDVANYCFNDFSTNDLNDSEIKCAKKLTKLNNKLINL